MVWWHGDRNTALAVLPMLGVGGMQLYKAESTGPIKDNKISPRIAETAQKSMGYIPWAHHYLRSLLLSCRHDTI